MNNLIEFFKNNFHYFLLAVLLVLSILMLGKSMSYSGYKLARFSQSITGPIQKSWSGVMHTFSLGPENEKLVQQNIALLREQDNMFIVKDDTTLTQMSEVDSLHTKRMRLYDYSYAHVIFKTTDQAFNYIIVDKGSEDGICKDMGPDPEVAFLENIPQHLEINVGDSVMTSGFSNIFPKGMLIGTVKEVMVGKNASFLTIKLRLATDFKRLGLVYLIENQYKSEIDTLKSGFKTE